jgi:hypothetical protein
MDNGKLFLFNYYWKLFNKTNSNNDDNYSYIQNHILFGRKLINLSKIYSIKVDREDNLKAIFFNQLPLDLSSENLLFLKFMKFHSGFVEFNNLFKPNRLDKIDVDEIALKDYISQKFYVCLEKSKREYKENINDLSDFQIISNICVKERLMYFNYLVDNNIERKIARNYINEEYMRVFRNKKRLPNLKNDLKGIDIGKMVEVYTR